MLNVQVKNAARVAAAAGLGLTLAFTAAPVVAMAEETVTEQPSAEQATVADIVKMIDEAQTGTTVELPAGTFDLSESYKGTLSVTKAVRLKGAEGGGTVIKGQIVYQNLGTASGESKAISVSGISFLPVDGTKQAVCIGGVSESNGYELTVQDCSFNGQQYCVTANSGATNCTVNVVNCTFTNVFCGMSVSNKNTIGTYTVAGTPGFAYAGQSFTSGGGENTPDRPNNGYYATTDDFTSNSNAVENVTAPATSWEAVATIGDKTVIGSLEEVVEELNKQEQAASAVIKLNGYVTLEQMLVIKKPVTINGNGHTISGASEFQKGENDQVNLVKLENVKGEVVLDSVQLLTSSANKHALDVYGCEDVVLKSVIIRHDDCISNGGAPLVINGSNVKIAASDDPILGTTTTIITGTNSWYAVNVDSKNGDASLTVEDGALLNLDGPKASVCKENSGGDSSASNTLKVDLGYPVVETTKEEGGKKQTYYQRAAAHIGSTNYASVEDAVKAAKEGDTITLYHDIDEPVTINKPGVTLDAAGYSIVNDGTSNTTVLVTANNVTVKNAKVVATHVKSHGVQFYNVTGGVLEGCTVEGGTYTSVIVNGSEATIKDCTLNPGENAYANIEFGMGMNVTTVPEVTLEGTVKLGEADTDVWVDSDTVDRIKTTMGGDPSNEQVVDKIKGNVVNNSTSDAKLSVRLDSASEPITEVVEGEKPVAPSEGEHAVKVDQAEGGKVAVTPSRADEGDEVTITATPDKGKEVRSVTVTTKDGKSVKVAKGSKANTWTFEMPDAEVTVKVTFGCDGGELCPTHKFDDVDAGAWYHDAVDWAVEEGLLSGYEDGTLGPDGTLSRAQLATVLWRQAGEPEATSEASFADCDPEAFYAEAVAWADEQGIVEGYGDGTNFGPEDPVTREQLATILWRQAGEPEGKGDLSDYPDGGDATDYAVPALEWAVDEGVLSGFGDGTLAPGGVLSRAMLAAMLQRMAE